MLREDEFRTNTNIIVTVFLAPYEFEGDPSISPRLNFTWSHELLWRPFHESGTDFTPRDRNSHSQQDNGSCGSICDAEGSESL